MRKEVKSLSQISKNTLQDIALKLHVERIFHSICTALFLCIGLYTYSQLYIGPIRDVRLYITVRPVSMHSSSMYSYSYSFIKQFVRTQTAIFKKQE
jgi:hypothetical protein